MGTVEVVFQPGAVTLELLPPLDTKAKGEGQLLETAVPIGIEGDREVTLLASCSSSLCQRPGQPRAGP